MPTTPSPTGRLTLGHLLDSAGVDPADVLVLRHTYAEGGLAGPSDLAPDPFVTYVREQDRGGKLGATPPPLWLNFMADGGRRSCFVTAYENHGEVPDEATDTLRYFDLRPSPVLEALRDRLVIQWPGDTVNWAKRADSVEFPVVEIADPQAVPFPGYDDVRLTFDELQLVVGDSRYEAWRVALGAVQGIYVITDATTGQHYIGKADGAERILGRWSTYARTGHGGNVRLRELIGSDPERSRSFRFSILRVFGPSVPAADVNAAEEHYKRALLTREFGLNAG